MGRMKLFRHKITGQEALYPDHFGDLAFLDLVPVDEGDETPCDDCVVETKPAALDKKKDTKNGK